MDWQATDMWTNLAMQERSAYWLRAPELE